MEQEIDKSSYEIVKQYLVNEEGFRIYYIFQTCEGCSLRCTHEWDLGTSTNGKVSYSIDIDLLPSLFGGCIIRMHNGDKHCQIALSQIEIKMLRPEVFPLFIRESICKLMQTLGNYYEFWKCGYNYDIEHNEQYKIN